MNISIDKDGVKKMGTSIIESSNDFKGEINKFLEIIDGINSAWEGADALKYINTLKEKYVVGLNELNDIINKYGQYLVDVPEAYDLLDETFSTKNINV